VNGDDRLHLVVDSRWLILAEPEVAALLHLADYVTLNAVFSSISVTSSEKMAEPELNVDSLISRLLEGLLRFTVVIFMRDRLRDSIKSMLKAVAL